MDFQESLLWKYKDILTKYLAVQSEQTLYLTQKLSKEILENHIPPEEVINLHKSVLNELIPEVPSEVLVSFDILLEIMMSYGLAYLEHQSLRYKQMELEMELEFGANMQKMLLGSAIPKYDYLDIGAISIPAKIMNGDYFHFDIDSDQELKVAIADVIGKGIPAALCMSMIKYAVDSLSYSKHNSPEVVLERLNRIVEKNVDLGIFITMFYGSYNPKQHVIQYASAGHEPGFFYNKKENSFVDLQAKGLLLGIDPHVTYPKFEISLEIGDMIILLSDGVTETRTEDGFLEREMIIDLLNKYMHLSAQEIVNNIYRDLSKIQHYQIRDDFTMIIMRRLV
ncbi:PP2C family protein-serine/threonine phosphatase [Caldibacillus lycopersici]|uniref:PP2C family protein-serine/threonine phosphatase n=1 Tax=Perspicuibacillus lycopersici TaxID=1325689 RepID=A0AAE3IVV8_9BACI|nr:PP2C family protein-serine/threonine phosphatase [Perspicuibacillus lycopersici]MCU9615167.1 PP2C family protein-serine/threonine phosphatase [Perspicuibacillus lycopersici]